MALKRVTIRVPEEVLAKARRAVEAGDVTSISAYFVKLAAREPDWARSREIIDEMIAEAGGIDDETRSWARSALGISDDDDATEDAR
ncbi:hypothetical protein [Pseudofrankia inefficax]|nr:hypothetical protein [Pseudofrankia inefficax]